MAITKGQPREILHQWFFMRKPNLEMFLRHGFIKNKWLTL
jgi:hypothetical protein